MRVRSWGKREKEGGERERERKRRGKEGESLPFPFLFFSNFLIGEKKNQKTNTFPTPFIFNFFSSSSLTPFLTLRKAAATNGVNFIHENDARLVVAGISEHFTDHSRALPNVFVHNCTRHHLRDRKVKVRVRERKKEKRLRR